MRTEVVTKVMFAHRGIWNKQQGIPENSVPAFRQAVQKRIGIELDIHLTKDDKIVVFHDDNLKRMTGIDKRIKECTWEELAKIKLDDTNYTIPQLQEVLKIVSGKVPLLIELKYDRKVGQLETKLMEIMKDYQGEFAIESFQPLCVNWFRKHYPQIVRGQLSSDFKKAHMILLEKIFLKNMLLNFYTKPDFIAYDVLDLPNKRIEKARKKKVIIGWTIKNHKQYQQMKPYCDNVIAEGIF